MSSPCRSSKLDPENPIPPPLPSEKASSRPPTPARGDAPVGSPLRSPLRHADNTIPPPVVTVAKANRMSRDDASAVVKLDGAGGMRAGERGLGTASAIVRRQRMTRAEAVLRMAAVLLCMISFSVMASDKTEGWAGDSFDRYKEFRFLVAINVIGFVYSLFQVYGKIHRVIAMKYIIASPKRYYFELAMDQILAYLLMSASSAAASRNDAWVSRFGRDDFTDKASGAIVMSFLAFVVFALSSLLSAYNLFRAL
ncbi:hypothetical protein OPV22_017867 [Ensete ventricosum]|uniref:CASP-like protein n=1 Tax=Ensete ventricosum TaxID=4639 RepID=A0AAV8R1Z1_ENSVE|nr:hypothetical protein OPV22_017867 [Ensete ventricosum]